MREQAARLKLAVSWHKACTFHILISVFHSTCWKTICDQGESNQKRKEGL